LPTFLPSVPISTALLKGGLRAYGLVGYTDFHPRFSSPQRLRYTPSSKQENIQKWGRKITIVGSQDRFDVGIPTYLVEWLVYLKNRSVVIIIY